MSDKRCGILSVHGPHSWGDLNWCPGTPTPVPSGADPGTGERAPYQWTRDDRADHEAGHPSGFDCDGYAMSSSEACGQRFTADPDTGEVEGLAAILRHHLPRDRYDEEGESLGTYCTCGGWTGGYFADGQAGPFDDHLATVLAAHVAAKQAEAWERGRQHGERNFISCPDDNPYRAATLGDAS